MAEEVRKPYRVKQVGKNTKHEVMGKKIGEVVYLTENQAKNWADKFEPIDEQWQKKTGGPSLEEFVAAGYKPEEYPPAGYKEVPSEGLTKFRAEQKTKAAPVAPAAPAKVDPLKTTPAGQ